MDVIVTSLTEWLPHGLSSKADGGER